MRPTAPRKNAMDPSASKGPQIAINGFIAFLFFIALTFVYFLWSTLPDHVLRSLHITYYPDKYWAVAVPAILVMLFFYYFTSSVFLVLLATHPLDDGRCVTDVDSTMDVQPYVGALSENSSSVPPWVDIPVAVSSKLLFQPWKDK